MLSAEHSEGLGYFFLKSADKHKNAICQVDGITGREETYGEIKTKSIRVAIELRSRGIGPGDVLSLCSYNRLEAIVPLLATTYLGAIFSSLDPILPLADCIHLLKITKPKMVFCGKEGLTLMEDAISSVGLDTKLVLFDTNDQGHELYENFLKENKHEEDSFTHCKPRNSKDPAFVYFSSGTSGFSKGVELSHYNLLLQTDIFSSLFFQKRSLSFASFYWISTMCAVMNGYALGNCRVIIDRFQESTAFKVLQDQKVTFTFLSPSATYKAISHLKAHKYDLSSLKQVCVGGGVISENVIDELRSLIPGALVARSYGMTEVNGYISTDDCNTYPKVALRANASGKLGNGFKIKVVEFETEKTLGPNQLGEIRLWTPTTMRGYYNNPEATKEAFDEDGYLYTGDIGYYDEDNYMYVTERIKDMFKYQSWHVAPATIEAVLQSHPDVGTGLVIGKPHEEDGDHALGIVMLKPGSKATAEEIANFVNDRVPDRDKLRAGVKIVSSVPVTPTGKFKKRILREMVINGLLD